VLKNTAGRLTKAETVEYLHLIDLLDSELEKRERKLKKVLEKSEKADNFYRGLEGVNRIIGAEADPELQGLASADATPTEKTPSPIRMKDHETLDQFRERLHEADPQTPPKTRPITSSKMWVYDVSRGEWVEMEVKEIENKFIWKWNF
jgi:hypothetical protein